MTESEVQSRIWRENSRQGYHSLFGLKIRSGIETIKVEINEASPEAASQREDSVLSSPIFKLSIV